MPKPWREVQASQAFQSLGAEDQQAAQRQYFDSVVVPSVGAENAEAAWGQFTSQYPVGSAVPEVPEGPVPELRTPPPMTAGEVAGGAIRNLPKSAGEAVKGIAAAVWSPLDTAKSLAKLGAGAVELAIPGEQGHEDSARAVGAFFAERYGGWENLKQTMAADPVGFLFDLSSVFTGGGAAVSAAGKTAKLAKVAKAAKVGEAAVTAGRTLKSIGAAVNPLTAARAVAKAPVASKTLARKLYRSALKPSTAKKPALLAKDVETALIHKITPDMSGAMKAERMIAKLETQIDDVIAAAPPGAKISADAVVKATEAWVESVKGQKAYPALWKRRFDAQAKKFLEGRPKHGEMTVAEAQAVKRDLYQVLIGKFSSQKSVGGGASSHPYTKAVEQKIAQAIKAEIETVVPDIKQLNLSQGALIELRQEVARAANRIANRDIFGMGDFLGVGIGGSMAGPQGAAVGLAARQILTRPSISSRVAINLYRRTPGTALGRRAAEARAAGVLSEAAEQ